MEMVATRSGRVGSLPTQVEASPGNEMDMVSRTVFRRRLLKGGYTPKRKSQRNIFEHSGTNPPKL